MKAQTLLKACVLWAIVLSGCSQRDSGPTEGSARQLGQSTPNAVWNGDLLKFTDPRLGYQIDLPSDWAITVKNIEIPHSYDTGVFMYSPGCNDPGLPTTPDQTCVGIQVFVLSTQVNDVNEFDRLVLDPPEYSDRSTQMTSHDREDVNGVPIHWYLLRFNDSSSELLYAKALFGKNAVGFRGYGDVDKVRSTLQTVRAIGAVVP